MDFGIALPNTIPGAEGDLLARWARRAEEHGFASVVATERLVYPGHDPMLALAVAAAVTSRVRLATNIVVAPLRSTTVLGKEAQTLQSLSGGRFVLGVGPGVREDDFLAAERSFTGRGVVFDRQLAELTAHGVGARSPGGPLYPEPVPVLVAGLSEAAVRRTVRWGSGWTAPGLAPEKVLPQARRVREAWATAGRPGQPRVVALLRFVLGADATAEAARFVRDYFAVTGTDPQIYVDETPSTPDRIRELVDQLAAGGVDEVVFHPTAAAVSQVDRLAEALFGSVTAAPFPPP